MTIKELFNSAVDRKASDLHIVCGYYPTVRINNELYPLKTAEIITREKAEKLIFPILSEEQKENLLANKEIDIGVQHENIRLRANIYYTKNQIAAAFRLVPSIIRTVEELNLPPVMNTLSQFNNGLVLVTGPTGEGKSTTLASIINQINMTTNKHIITIEDPIEFVYPEGKCVVSQRELHLDTHSWTIALRSVLREDPDVVLVGEMRDYDTIQAVITIAETGHLVFSTLHTSTTPEAVNRIIDVFPSHQQNQIKNQLASVLKAVVTQRLVPDISNTSRVPALEILINTPAVSSLIREGKAFMLDNVLETEEKQDMVLFEKYLSRIYKRGLISKETALKYAIRGNEMKKLL